MIYNIIEVIANISSSNEKIEILRKNKDNELLKKVLYYCYNPLFNYFTTHQTVEYRQYDDVEDEGVDLEFIFPLLDKLIDRYITGNVAKEFLDQISDELHYLDRIILNRIIGRDMKCGISVKTINKVFPDLIPTIPYMRCSVMDKIDRIKFPAIIQRKMDGMFVNVVYKDGVVKFFTRTGTQFDLKCLKVDFEDALVNNHKNVVFHGELLVESFDSGVESRNVGNGLINSLIKKDQTIETLYKKIEERKGKSSEKLSSELSQKINEFDNTDKRVRIVIWDLVPYEDWIKGESKNPYFTSSDITNRWDALSSFVHGAKSNHIELVDYKFVENIEQAKSFYLKQIEEGYEGAVLKNFSLPWKNHTSTEQIKLKAEREADLIVYDFIPGVGKYTGGIGSLCCRSADGKIEVDVSGKSDDMRGFERVDVNDSSKGIQLKNGFDCNCYNGKIFKVIFNEVIDNEKGGYSLFLPRLAENYPRIDKDVADDFETIMKM